MFGYDALGRVTSFSGFTSASTSENQTFTYDANGNRLSAATNGTVQTYTYASGTNRLASVAQGGQNVSTNTFDAAGNMVSDGSRTFAYDARGRMVQSVVGTLTTNYQYNGHGLRVRKSNPEQTRIFVYDESGHMLGEYDAAGGAIQELIWLGDTPVAISTVLPGSSTVGLGYIWTDHLNTPRELTRINASNQHVSIWKWDSLPFGETAPNANPSSLGVMVFNHRFPGQYFDVESNLNQNWNRDYDPRIGRYVTSDPSGLAGGVNTYAYVANDPNTRTDLRGLDMLDEAISCYTTNQCSPWMQVCLTGVCDTAVPTLTEQQRAAIQAFGSCMAGKIAQALGIGGGIIAGANGAAAVGNVKVPLLVCAVRMSPYFRAYQLTKLAIDLTDCAAQASFGGH
jgi:RHS repeat-associated protein